MRRRRTKLISCPFHRDNTSRQVDGDCFFQGSPNEVKQHLRSCIFQNREVKQLAETQASYFQKHPTLATAAAKLLQETLQRVQAGSLDEHREVLRDEPGKVMVVLGLRSQTLRETLSLLAETTLQEEDAEWRDFVELCLPGVGPPEIASRFGPRPVPGMLGLTLRDDVASNNGARPCEHSLMVWVKALADAVAIHGGAPDTRAKLLESLDMLSSKDDVEGKVLATFRGWDIDDNGIVSQLEFASLLRSLDSTISFDSAEALFRAADADRSGGIDYQELVAWLFRDDAEQPSPQDMMGKETSEDEFANSTLRFAFPPAGRQPLA